MKITEQQLKQIIEEQCTWDTLRQCISSLWSKSVKYPEVQKMLMDMGKQVKNILDPVENKQDFNEDNEMKITEQRLKEIIIEELMNENVFKKMLGMKGDRKKMQPKRQMAQDIIAAWMEGGYEDMQPSNHKHRKKLDAFEQEYDPQTVLNHVKGALKMTHDSKEKKEFQTYVNTLNQMLTAIADTDDLRGKPLPDEDPSSRKRRLGQARDDEARRDAMMRKWKKGRASLDRTDDSERHRNDPKRRD